MGVNRQELEGADERHWHQRNTSANCDVRRSPHEGLHLAIFRAAAFRKNEKRHARLERANGAIEPSAPIFVYRNLARTIQMPSDERPLPKTLFGENSKLEREAAEHQGSIHKRGVVRGVHRNRQQVLTSDNSEGRTRKPQCTPSPQAGDVMLPTAIYFEA